MFKLNRRDFARNTALAALFSPFLSLLDGNRANAAVGKAKYLLVFYTNGTNPAMWSPVGSTDTQINWSEMTEPLSAIKGDVVLIEKLSSNGTADNHAAPGGLTGVGYSAQERTSLDGFLEDALAAAGIRTAIPSLRLGGVASEQQGTFYYKNELRSPIFSPEEAFGLVFPNGGVAAPMPGGPMVDTAEVARRLARKHSVLDLVNAELTQLSMALGTEERQILELHADSLRQMEERLGQGMVGGGGPILVSADCSAPIKPTAANQPLLNSALHLDLALQAFACDITRVAAVSFGHHQSTQIDMPEVGKGDWHNEFIHGGKNAELLGTERWLCTQFVAAVEKLKALPAPDGAGTLFDQTLLVWARDMGDAVGHNGNDMRFVFAGATGYLRTSPEGRYIDGSGGLHQQALINCIEALGIADTTGFGDPAAARAPLAALGG